MQIPMARSTKIIRAEHLGHGRHARGTPVASAAGLQRHRVRRLGHLLLPDPAVDLRLAEVAIRLGHSLPPALAVVEARPGARQHCPADDRLGHTRQPVSRSTTRDLSHEDIVGFRGARHRDGALCFHGRFAADGASGRGGVETGAADRVQLADVLRGVRAHDGAGRENRLGYAAKGKREKAKFAFSLLPFPLSLSLFPYSARSATTASTRVARRAGI
jgi:hypothetical protein